MGGGWSGGGDCIHGLDGNPMNADKWSPVILTLVTFIPLAGALLLLLLLPRRDRDIRVFSLVVTLLYFCPVTPPARAFSSGPERIPV